MGSKTKKSDFSTAGHQTDKTRLARNSGKTQDRKVKWFNIIFGALLISGMLLSALGGRSRVNRNTVIDSNSSIAKIVFTWQSQSLEGDCRQVIVYENGHFQDGLCGKASQEYELSAPVLQKVLTWVNTLQAFSYSPKQQAGNINVQLAFNGRGARPATAEDLQAIEILAEQLATQN